MSWERRHRYGRQFLYRVERRGGKLAKTYVGPYASPVVQLIGRLDRSRQALVGINHAAELAEDSADRDRDQRMRAYDVRLALVRKLIRRDDPMKLRSPMSRGKSPNADTVHGITNCAMPTQAEFLALVHRAEKGSERAQKDLRDILDANPQIWQHLGDVGNLVEGHLVNLAAQDNFVLRESICRRVAELREQLCTSHDPLEKLLADRVVVAWLELQHRQIRATTTLGETSNRIQQRRLDQAQRRHVDSVVALRDFQQSRMDCEYAAQQHGHTDQPLVG